MMLSSLTAGQFAKWFALATLLIASGTVFFGPLLAIIVPLEDGGGAGPLFRRDRRGGA